MAGFRIRIPCKSQERSGRGSRVIPWPATCRGPPDNRAAPSRTPYASSGENAEAGAGGGGDGRKCMKILAARPRVWRGEESAGRDQGRAMNIVDIPSLEKQAECLARLMRLDGNAVPLPVVQNQIAALVDP